MKVLLIDPAGAQRYVTHNAGLAYLSSSLLARGHDVRVLDMNNYSYADREVVAYARAYQPDWVGASVKTALVSSAERTVREIQGVCPDARPSWVVPTSVCRGRDYMASQDVYEFGLTGEGERALADLVEGKNPSEIACLIYYDDGEWRQNRTEFIFDLEQLGVSNIPDMGSDRPFRLSLSDGSQPGLSLSIARFAVFPRSTVVSSDAVRPKEPLTNCVMLAANMCSGTSSFWMTT